VTTANGVSGTVATATTTPAISISLGAITPTSVAASGAVSGSNLSGTNTGDQTSVSGNAGTATALATARNIFNISFNGTANVAGDATNTGHFASIPGTGAAGHFVTENGTTPTLIAGRSAWYSDGSGIPSFKNGTGTAVTLVRSSDLGTGVGTFLATPSSANLAAAVTDETGTGALVFGTSPTFTTSIIAGSSTMALLNTTATTVNAFGAATNIVLGGACTVGLTTTSQVYVPLNSLTSGTGLYLASTSLTSGKLLDISTTSLNVSGSIVGLNIGLSGSNFTSLVTTTGATISNTRTGSSSTNVALTLTASGGTTNNALNITAGNSLFPNGSASAPSIQFGSDTDCGIYYIGTNNFGFATSGTLRWHISSSGHLFSGSGNYDYNISASLIKGSSGSASAPTFTFGSSGDENTGMYRISEGVIGFASDGSLQFTVGTAGVTVAGTLGVTGATTLTGNLTSNGALISTPQALSGAGAINITTLTTAFTATAPAHALTLANGTNGQIKTVCMVATSGGGTGVLTPTTKTGYTTVTFGAAGDSVMLQFFTTAGWCVIGSRGVVIA